MRLDWGYCSSDSAPQGLVSSTLDRRVYPDCRGKFFPWRNERLRSAFAVPHAGLGGELHPAGDVVQSCASPRKGGDASLPFGPLRARPAPAFI